MRIILFAFALITSQYAGAQAYKDSIRSQFMVYNDLLLKKDFAASLDYVNPGILTVAPREQLIQMMEQTFNNPEVEIKLSKPELKSIEDSQRIDSMTYATFEYEGSLSMRFASEEAKKQDTSITMAALRNQFGQENVKYDASTGFFHVKVIKKVIANSGNAKNWTFLVIEEAQKAVLEKFVPKELLQ